MALSDAAVGANAAACSEPFHLEPVSGDVESPVAEQVRELGEAEFREDVLEIVEADSLWDGVALMDEVGGLVGFVVFGVLSGIMSLRYISVVPARRRRGCGRQLVEYVRGRCVERGVREISLFCRRELVGFYRSLGFHEVPDEEEGDSEDDLQVPMALRIPQPGEAPGGIPPRLDEAEDEDAETEEEGEEQRESGEGGGVGA